MLSDLRSMVIVEALVIYAINRESQHDVDDGYVFGTAANWKYIHDL